MATAAIRQLLTHDKILPGTDTDTGTGNMNLQARVLVRRMIAGGAVASVLYGAMLLLVVTSKEANVSWSLKAVLVLATGPLIAFFAGAVALGVIPHLIGMLMNRSSSFFGILNHAAMFVALMSVAIGVISALMMVFGAAKAGTTSLIVSIILFVGASAIMCTLKFFHANRERE